MMLKKIHRLRGKDVSYIIRKKNYKVTGSLWFFWIAQYPQRLYNQFSVAIPVSVSKKAVTRHMIKRIVLDYVRTYNFVHEPLHGSYWKIFVTIPKSTLPIRQKIVASTSRKDISSAVQTICKTSFTSFFSLLWAGYKR